MKTRLAIGTAVAFAPNPAPPSVELSRLGRKAPELVEHKALLEVVAGLEFRYPEERFSGRGVVICGGGTKYFPCVYVLVRLLRHLGCPLPIEVWHLGREEMSLAMRTLLAALGAQCIDAQAMRRVHPARRLAGWELKCYALLHCRFAEALLLDADNCPVRDPSFLFETSEYRRSGALFWPDFGRFGRKQAVWEAAGIAFRDEPEFESGQIVVDKRRCWKALEVAMHLNEYSDWWYRVIHGDKDTFHLAWRKIGQEYAMPPHPVRALDGVMLQFDFAGDLLFQHRNFGKWTLHGNRRIPGFQLEKECLGFIAELRGQWSELPPDVRLFAPEAKTSAEVRAAQKLMSTRWEYERVGYDRRVLTFLSDGRVGEGAAGCEAYWGLGVVQGRIRLEVFSSQHRTFTACKDGHGGWSGRWEVFEAMPVRLRPVSEEPRKRRGQDNVRLRARDEANGVSMNAHGSNGTTE